MRLQEKVDQQRFDLRAVAIDLVILRRMTLRRVLHTVERALPGHRLAVWPQHRRHLPRQHRKGRVFAQLVVIIEILVAQGQAEHPLPKQRLEPVLDKPRIAPVGETLGKAPDQTEAAIHFAQQQGSAVRCDVAAVKAGDHRAPLHYFKSKQPWSTLCLHRGAPETSRKLLRHNNFLRVSAPMHFNTLRNSG